MLESLPQFQIHPEKIIFDSARAELIKCQWAIQCFDNSFTTAANVFR